MLILNRYVSVFFTKDPESLVLEKALELDLRFVKNCFVVLAGTCYKKMPVLVGNIISFNSECNRLPLAAYQYVEPAAILPATLSCVGSLTL